MRLEDARVKQAEQVVVLRKLWTEDVVSYEGRFHEFSEVTLVPAPKQRPIPIWLGGFAEPVIKRAALLGDGWMPILAPDDTAKRALETLHEHLATYGRERSDFGIEAWLRCPDNNPDTWAASADGWRALGADTQYFIPCGACRIFEEQLETLRRFKEVASG